MSDYKVYMLIFVLVSGALLCEIIYFLGICGVKYAEMYTR